MSALNFVLAEDFVIVSMDTLALRAEDHKPHKYVSKFFLLPHMNCVICGTGNMDAIVDWFAYIEKRLVGNGIFQLNKSSIQLMPGFMKEKNGNNLCTIYQFGLSEIDYKYHGYAYRYKNDFISEELEYGLGIKPTEAILNDDNPIDLNDVLKIGDVSDITLSRIMHRQKNHDDNLDINNRLGIGGMIQILYLEKNNMLVRNYQAFDDFNETYEDILDNLNN